MKPTTAFLFLLFALGCKGTALQAEVLQDAPAPTLPTGWITTPSDIEEFSFALPEGWNIGRLQTESLKQFVKTMNENAWSMMGQQQADVDFEKATAYFCERSATTVDFSNPLHMEDQFLVVIREDFGKQISLKQAADRWRDTIRLEGEQNPPKETSATLPVGNAICLTKSNASMGIIEKVTVYVLVDDTVLYTFFFNETATKDANPIPALAIMETFRPKHG